MRRIITLSIGIVLLAGCGGGNSRGGLVEGKLTYKGRPVNGAALSLYPETGGDAILIPVDQDGEFRSSDVPPGDYTVVVEGTPGDPGPPTAGMPPDKLAKAKEKLAGMSTPPTIPFPDKYKVPATSDKRVKVVPGKQTMDLDLTD
jgi:hypothetical protein